MLLDRHNGAHDKESYEDDITEALIYVLPHGAGIDADWSIEFLKNGNVICHNAYHCINQSGYYDGWIDFWIKLIVKNGVVVDFKLTGAFHKRENKYPCLKEYLYDTFAYALDGVLNH